MIHTPLYDVDKTYDENLEEGPFGDYADGKVYLEQGEPSHDFFGHKVYEPFGIAAGPLPHSRFIKAVFDKGYDIATFKSVRTDIYPCHPKPNILPIKFEDQNIGEDGKTVVTDDEYKEPLSVANSYGIPSLKPEVWQPLLKEALSMAHDHKGKALLASFQGTDRAQGSEAFLQDHIRGVQFIQETGADVIEVNLSCPNEGSTEFLCFMIDDAERIIKKVRQVLKNEALIVKLAYFKDKEQLEEFARRIGPYVDGISAINTIATKLVDSEGNQAFPGGQAREKPGLSGRAIKKAGINMTEHLVKFREKFKLAYKVVSMGGVLNPQDYADYRNAGADFVLSVTGAMWNPYLAQEIKVASK